MSQRIPRLDDDVSFGEEFLQLLLLVIGVYLCLEDCRFHLAYIKDFLDLLFIEVGKSDGLHLAFLVCLFHQAVAGHIVSCRLMSQEQINLICIQSLKRLVHFILLLVERVPQLSLQEDLT